VRISHLTPALALAAVLTVACDPNVVIGAKLRVSANPMAAGSGSGGADSRAAAGSGGSGEGGTTQAAGGTTAGGSGALGQAGADDLIFDADHEDGSIAIWDEGTDMDSGGYYADANVEPPHYSENVAHSGQGSAEITIDTSTGTAPIGRLYRRIESESAYYSAWFYLLEDHTPSSWWSIFLFRARRDRSDSLDLWSVDLIRVDGRLSLSLYDHQRSQDIDVPSEPIIPIAQWFQLEAYLEFGPDQPSRLDFWLDGEPVLSLPDLNEMPEDEPVYWVVGNGGDVLMPPVSTLYIDDAIISPMRVGVQ
jgi:hypothetical protein